MRRVVVALVMLVGLGACGVDGPPIRPQGFLNLTLGGDTITTNARVIVAAGTVHRADQ